MHPPYSKKQEKSAMETSEILKRVRQIEIKNISTAMTYAT